MKKRICVLLLAVSVCLTNASPVLASQAADLFGDSSFSPDDIFTSPDEGENLPPQRPAGVPDDGQAPDDGQTPGDGQVPGDGQIPGDEELPGDVEIFVEGTGENTDGEPELTVTPAVTPTVTPTVTPEADELADFSAEETKTAQAAGWQKNPESGTWSYYAKDKETQELKPLTGKRTVSGKNYLFDKEGILLLGFQKTTGGIVYLSKTGSTPAKGLGVIKKGWLSVGGKSYYAAKTGFLAKGFYTLNGYKYYFANNNTPGKAGVMSTGFARVESSTYYFQTAGGAGVKGRMNSGTGWITVGKYTYYLKKGKVLTGFQTINSRRFYLNPSTTPGVTGRLRTGEVKVGNDDYYFKKTGAPGVKGQGVTGWLNLSRGRCYAKTGKLLKGQYFRGYYLGVNGAMNAKSKKLYTLVTNVIKSRTNGRMSKSQKLRACYNYVVDGFSYKRKYDFSNTDAWPLNYAYQMLTEKKGNCYNYAAAFGFLAREIGYDAKIINGLITAAAGGFTPHGWVEISGRVYDTEMEHAQGMDLYNKTYGATGMTYIKTTIRS